MRPLATHRGQQRQWQEPPGKKACWKGGTVSWEAQGDVIVAAADATGAASTIRWDAKKARADLESRGIQAKDACL
eukprot:5996449-Prymnesium_polylepis.1